MDDSLYFTEQHLAVRVVGEQSPHPFPDDEVVVRQHHADPRHDTY